MQLATSSSSHVLHACSYTAWLTPILELQLTWFLSFVSVIFQTSCRSKSSFRVDILTSWQVPAIDLSLEHAQNRMAMARIRRTRVVSKKCTHINYYGLHFKALFKECGSSHRCKLHLLKIYLQQPIALTMASLRKSLFFLAALFCSVQTQTSNRRCYSPTRQCTTWLAPEVRDCTCGKQYLDYECHCQNDITYFETTLHQVIHGCTFECSNGGTLVSRPDGYFECDCRPGYYGFCCERGRETQLA